MISFSFNLRNPFVDRFKNLWNRSYDTLLKNKCIEIEVIEDDCLISFRFSWTIQQDHAGLDLEMGVLGYQLHFNLYDMRHWNYENNCWEIYERTE
jgi:hypothetical protein